MWLLDPSAAVIDENRDVNYAQTQQKSKPNVINFLSYTIKRANNKTLYTNYYSLLAMQ